MIIKPFQQPKCIATANEDDFRFGNSSPHVGNIVDRGESETHRAQAVLRLGRIRFSIMDSKRNKDHSNPLSNKIPDLLLRMV